METLRLNIKIYLNGHSNMLDCCFSEETYGGEGLGRVFLPRMSVSLQKSTVHTWLSGFIFSLFELVRPFYIISSGKYLAPSVGIKQGFDIQ